MNAQQHSAITHEEPLAPQMRIPVREAEEAAPLPLLDELWHFSCVIVRPLPRFPSTPHSPLSASSPAKAPDLISSPSSPAPLPLNQHAQPSAGAASQRHVLHRIFDTFDQNRDGLVSYHEIAQIFQKLGMPQDERCIQSLLARLVTKTAAHVNEQEFCQLYATVCTNTEPNSSSACSEAGADEDLLAAFNVFDKDGNGLISPSELQSVLCSLGFPQARQLDACVEMISRVDNNADGHVDFFEFKNLFYPENPILIS